jgi:DnaJ-class molecular chaperone
MADKDFYGTLGVARDIPQEDLRTAYRKLAREHHPDVNPNDPKAEERFKEITAAYAVLSDPEKRTLYDEFGTQGLQDGFDPNEARSYQQWQRGAHRSPFQQDFRSEMDLEDLLGSFFRAGGGGGSARGLDAAGEVTVDFKAAALGEEVSVQLDGQDGGRALRVTVPPGAADGTKIRLAGQGGPGGDDGPRGDLYLTLRVRPHAFFSREQDDIFVDVPVTLPELMLGASIQVPTLEDPVAMKVPPGSDNGRKLRLRGKGALTRNRKDRGDLYVHLIATLPSGGGPRLSELAKEMESLYEDENVRAKLGVT